MNTKLAVVRQLSHGKHKPIEVEIEFTNSAGSTDTLREPKSILTNLRLLHQRLVDADAALDTDFKAAKGLLAKLQNESRSAKSQQIARIGWSDDFSSFAFPRRILNQDAAEKQSIAPGIADPTWEYMLPVSGTTNGWNQAIRVARESSALTFLAAVAFAAPCLKLLGRSSFGFVLHGPAKIGKSTATLLCASAFGFKDEPALPNFSATETALNELGAVFNDMVFPINELGAATGHTKELAALLMKLAYRTGEAQTKRYSKFAEKIAGVGRPLPARCIVLLNSEVSAGQIARAARRSRFKGEAIRLIDLVLISPGHATIFDLSKDPNDIARSKKLCRQLREGIEKNHGFASRKFLKYVFVDVERTKAKLLCAIDEIMSGLADKATSPDALHMADSFALIYAAGSLAVKRKILPFTEAELKEATIVCFERACRSLPSDENRAQDCYEALKADYLAGVFPLQLDAVDECVGNEDGYVTTGGELVLKGEYLSQRFSGENEAYLLVRKLHSMGLLQKKIKVPSSPTNSIRWAQTQKTWPDGSRRRSIVINTK